MLDHTLFPVGSLPLPYEGHDNLVNGPFPQVRLSVQISADESDLKKGSVLGKVSDGPNKGAYKLAKADAKDGSSIPSCILAEDYKAQQKIWQMPVYLTGQFNTRSITLGDGLEMEGVVIELRKLSIFLSPSIKRTY